jgi:hypothetical protein
MEPTTIEFKQGMFVQIDHNDESPRLTHGVVKAVSKGKVLVEEVNMLVWKTRRNKFVSRKYCRMKWYPITNAIAIIDV